MAGQDHAVGITYPAAPSRPCRRLSPSRIRPSSVPRCSEAPAAPGPPAASLGVEGKGGRLVKEAASESLARLLGAQAAAEVELRALRRGLSKAEAEAEDERQRVGAEVSEVRKLQSQLARVRADHENLLRLLEQGQASTQHQWRQLPADMGQANEDRWLQLLRYERRRNRSLEARLAEATSERDELLARGRPRSDAAKTHEELREEVETLRVSRDQLVHCLKYKHESAKQAHARLERAEAQRQDALAQERQAAAALQQRAEAQEPLFVAEAEHNKMLFSFLGTLEARLEKREATEAASADRTKGSPARQAREESAEDRVRARCLEAQLAASTAERGPNRGEEAEELRRIEPGREEDTIWQLQQHLQASEAERDAAVARLAVSEAERVEMAQGLSDERARIGHLSHELEALTAARDAEASAFSARAAEAAGELATATRRLVEEREELAQGLAREGRLARSLREELFVQAPRERSRKQGEAKFGELRRLFRQELHATKAWRSRLSPREATEERQTLEALQALDEMQQSSSLAEVQSEEHLESPRTTLPAPAPAPAASEYDTPPRQSGPALAETERVLAEMQEQLSAGDEERERLRQNLKMERRRTRFLQLQLGARPAAGTGAGGEAGELRAKLAAAEAAEEDLCRSLRQERREAQAMRGQLESLEPAPPRFVRLSAAATAAATAAAGC